MEKTSGTNLVSGGEAKREKQKLSQEQLRKVTGGVGTDGNDRIYGSHGDDMLFSGDGNDTVYGGHGDDVISGGDGNDNLHGGSGDDIILGGSGNDYISGGDGDDTAYGGSGNDRLDGGVGAGNDTLDGGSGNDSFIYYRGDGNDVYSGGVGNDTLILGKVGNGAGWTISFGDGPAQAFGDVNLSALPETAGTITTPDGETIVFDSIENIVIRH